MANVSDLLLLCLADDVINLSLQIVIAHLYERILPKFLHIFLRVRVQTAMDAAILGTARVSEPDIVALGCQLERRRLIVLIYDPSVGRAEQSMLEHDDWFFSEADSPEPLALNSKHVQDVAIFCFYCVALVGETVLFDYLFETFEVVTHDYWDFGVLGLIQGRLAFIHVFQCVELIQIIDKGVYLVVGTAEFLFEWDFEFHLCGGSGNLETNDWAHSCMLTLWIELLEC